MSTPIDPATLASWLVDGDELAVLDAREQGVYFDSHLFHAACLPLSYLELKLERSVPRKTTRLVWCDDGELGLAELAAERSQAMGWTNIFVLTGGTSAWAADGRELYSGVNVPSKAFGEFVEHTYGTPRIPASELRGLLDEEANLIVLDSRPLPEYTNMSIPTGIDCPGAELVHRVKEMVTDPETLVVVNCAGRTRSIIGAQSLINAGLENRVVALENGTMGWELAGFDVVRGSTTFAPAPGDRREGADWASTAATAVGKRFGVESIDHETLRHWQVDPSRTTYLLDVRNPDEFTSGHLAGSLSAPGGQLVQATDEYVGTRNARLVLVDDDRVRATMTASWLRQLGWNDAVVLEQALDGQTLHEGPTKRVSLGLSGVQSISPAALSRRFGDLAILDIGTSIKYRKKGHIPGAWWGVRSRFGEAKASIGDPQVLVLTSTDGQLAKAAVADAQATWPDASVFYLAGGTKSWRHAGFDMEPGLTRPTTATNDVWYKPYDHDEADVVPQHMQDYLTWEIALVEQLDRDPTVQFPSF